MQPVQGSTRLDLPRAPSPTEARPLRRIPVPEDFVPLGAREWDPNRKFWAAAATCHMPLYFQDAALERGRNAGAPAVLERFEVEGPRGKTTDGRGAAAPAGGLHGHSRDSF